LAAIDIGGPKLTDRTQSEAVIHPRCI